MASDCPDYRFTYERESPFASAIIEAVSANPMIRRKRLPQVWPTLKRLWNLLCRNRPNTS